ncbi:kinesin-like protein Nod isoform X2 [Sitophilus oryzae]|uniref:Kinesin-like protein n=1 Tax=Sitophilus oryzae TaxID=7048 RepID=A0A6J2XCX3_SITOR|nr:kinesin-like protein Nod isoform X2 [Sitophilus oryzae]
MEVSKKECITVSIRIKPTLKSKDTSCIQVISKEPPVLAIPERSQAYHFDNIFSDEIDQEEIYDKTVKPLVDHVKKGYNCTVFAYGQTGTGKTYTMGTGFQGLDDLSHVGIIPRVLNDIFTNHADNNEFVDIGISFLEIYNEKVFDLLQPDRKTPLSVSGFVVQDMAIKIIDSIDSAMMLLELGSKKRHVAETKQNINSSRSHAIFTVYFTGRNGTEEVKGKINLVDLAGSESVRKTGNTGSTFQEGVSINKGLLSIGQVISALSMKSAYIPYRQTMITSILQGSLNVDNYISLIACVSASSDNITETLQTLDFSQRAKKIRSNPEVNQIITKYKKEHSSAIRTPLKRQTTTPLKTPARKKTIFSMPLINEANQSQIDNSNQISVCSSSVTSIMSNYMDITQETLSPVIRKYITKMEVSIMDKLESVIKNSLKTPAKSSPLAAPLQADKENTPGMSWNKIQNEVSKLVKSEIAQLKVKTVRATSSPIDGAKIKRVLEYDSPADEINNTAISETDSNKDFGFKMPMIPTKKYKQSKNLQNSALEIEPTGQMPRRSMRLSMKKHDASNVSDMSFDSTMTKDESSFIQQPEASEQSGFLFGDQLPIATPRRSTRLSKKPTEDIDLNTTKNSCDISCSSLLNSSERNLLNAVRSKKKNIAVVRKSVGFITKYKSPKTKKKRKGAKKSPVHKLISQSKRDSPRTVHSKAVLKILNDGNLKDLGTLHSVGAKTGEQILLYRKLKGSFNEIEDLSLVPGWGTKKFERFMTLNLLKM